VALIYPGFLMFAGIAVTVLFITYLIPKLMTLIKSSRSKPPAVATAMIWLSEFLKTNWWLILLVIIALVTAFILFIRSPGGKPVWDRIKLKIPFVGNVLMASLHSQFLETLASLSSGGLPLLKGLELASRVTDNIFARGLLAKSIEVVKDGGNLSRALERTGLFPTNMVEMVRLGEHTGDLPAALRRAADRCARELGKTLEKAAAAIQPLIILIMAGIVGLMAYLMISIIFDTISTLNNRKQTSYQPQQAIIQHYEHLA
jgi:type II secretory pathway component PulF